MSKKVIIAMSGGVDSSVAAALLKGAGFNVIGVFMKFWVAPKKHGIVGAWNRCCSPEAEKRARKVAKILKIPFYVFSFEKEFKEKIVDYFLAEYKKGITPNPCVICNKEIKFGLLLKKALTLDIDYVATGHYARLRKEKDKIHLLRGKDKKKDQSYFLWQLNQKQLKRILFPVGDYTKEEVKKLAKKFQLPVLKIPESMEICFVQTAMVAEASPHLPPRSAQRSGQSSVNDFLRKHLKEKPGKIINAEGKSVGEHKGLHFYTIGQRKGIKLAKGPFYVFDKDLKKNLLMVTKNEKDLDKKELRAKNVNWISGKVPKFPLKIKAKIRYHNQPISAIITHNLKSKVYNLKFNNFQRAITPGQSVVFLKGQELLGGGIIC